MLLEAVLLAHKKRITVSHPVGEASGNSFSNGCQAKTKRRSELVGVVVCSEGTKTSATRFGRLQYKRFS